jgi:hypothetical protein
MTEPTKFQAQLGRLPLYVRFAWGLLLAFGMVGQFARPSSPVPVYIYVMVAIMWACVRIITEAIDAYHILALARASDAKNRADKKDDREPPGPSSPA